MKEIIIEQPVFDVDTPKPNILRHLGYYSYEQRIFDLANYFKKNIDVKMTETIKATTYCGVGSTYIGYGAMKNHTIFNGVYKLAPFEEYFGHIPIENQIEIDEKYTQLINNPFLTQKFELVILAPLNNFATENNIKAIDPIVFARFTTGEHCYTKYYLITLSQWV